jgi:threonyl-tRNA synthetase
MFDSLMASYKLELQNKPRNKINIEMRDGRILEGLSYETTPLSIAQSIGKSLAERTVISKVDGELFDLTRPLEKSCSLELLDFESQDGKKVFWHSSAHVLGEACELHYGCHLCIGPPIEEGFFYEMAMERAVSQTDFSSLETLTKRAITEKQVFERLEVSKENLLEMFKVFCFLISTTNIKCILLTTKSPTGQAPLFIVVVR